MPVYQKIKDSPAKKQTKSSRIQEAKNKENKPAKMAHRSMVPDYYQWSVDVSRIWMMTQHLNSCRSKDRLQRESRLALARARAISLQRDRIRKPSANCTTI
jgi:hypothetical protein